MSTTEVHDAVKYAILRRSCRAEVAAWTSYLSAPLTVACFEINQKMQLQISSKAQQKQSAARLYRHKEVKPVTKK